MNVTLSDIDGNVLNGSVYIKELGQYVDVVDGKGSFDFIVPVNAVAGTVYGFVGNYSGSLDYYGSSGSGSVTVDALYYHIVKVVVSDVGELYPGDNVTFTITVFNDNTNASAILRNVTVRNFFNASLRISKSFMLSGMVIIS